MVLALFSLVLLSEECAFINVSGNNFRIQHSGKITARFLNPEAFSGTKVSA